MDPLPDLRLQLQSNRLSYSRDFSKGRDTCVVNQVVFHVWTFVSPQLFRFPG